MKIIKFLSKLSLFDWISISGIFIFSLVFFLFFFRKAEFISIRVKVTDQDVLYQRTEPKNWYADRFVVGDVERDALGRVITQITGIESFDIDSKTRALYLDLKLRAVYDTRSKLYSARGKQLVFGTPMRFYLSKVTFDGFVTEFPGSESPKNLQEAKTKVIALGRSIEPSIANSVKKGNQIKDSNGILLAEIEKVEVKPAETVTQTDRGDLLLRNNPLFKDLIITVNVRTKTVYGETYIFDNLPFKVGQIIPLNFKTVSLFPMITSINEN